MINNYIL